MDANNFPMSDGVIDERPATDRGRALKNLMFNQIMSKTRNMDTDYNGRRSTTIPEGLENMMEAIRPARADYGPDINQAMQTIQGNLAMDRLERWNRMQPNTAYGEADFIKYIPFLEKGGFQDQVMNGKVQVAPQLSDADMLDILIGR